MANNRPCPHCGASVTVHYGPDIRFTPPCSKPMMYRAECSKDCPNPSYTSFTRESALDHWNRGVALFASASDAPRQIAHVCAEVGCAVKARMSGARDAAHPLQPLSDLTAAELDAEEDSKLLEQALTHLEEQANYSPSQRNRESLLKVIAALRVLGKESGK